MVLRALGLGDLLTAVPALRALASAFPDHHRVLAAPAVLDPLARLSATVDEVVDTRPLAPLSSTLHGADVALNLHGRGPQSHRVLSAAAPRRLIAFAHPDVPESAEGPFWSGTEHEVVRWCRLLHAGGIPADPTELDLNAPGQPPPPEAHGATVVHPGAASVARRWPVDRWAEVARHEVGNGRLVLVTGGPDKRVGPTSWPGGRSCPRSPCWPAAPSLPEWRRPSLRPTWSCAGTPASPTGHRLGTPSVVLFGPVSPAHRGPPPDRTQHVALWSGAVGDPHATRPDTGLLQITVAEVLAALPYVREAGQARPRASTMRST